jgi:penicillin-binding protein 1A
MGATASVRPVDGLDPDRILADAEPLGRVQPRRRRRTVALVLRRAVLALLAATLTVAALIVLTAWAALRVSWAVPDPGAMAGPTELLDRNGAVIARFASEVDREVVELDEVADVARDAVIVAEDHRFYEHSGVDPLSLLRAVATNVRTGGIAQGGSTLTQQYVKSAFVGDQRTLLRKVREAVISIQLERDVDKDEILERYLNEVYFGEGAYGIEAAARVYFDTTAAELQPEEAATLAQLLPAPSVRNPRSDPTGAQARRDALLQRMAETGRLDRAAAQEARGRELDLADPPAVQTRAPAFTDHVRRQLEHAFGDRVLQTGALTVRTSLDLGAQETLDTVAAERLPADEVGEVDSAMVAVDPGTGDVLALHGGRDMGIGDFNLATMMTGRQQGSALKPFVFAAALEEEIAGPDSTRPAPSRVTIGANDCVGHDGAAITVGGGGGGSTSISEALVQSYNTTFQLLGCQLGGERVVEQARRMGVRNEISTNAGVALGGTDRGASPLDMASAYGTFANDGRWCPPRTILEITGPEGERVEVPDEVITVPDQERLPLAWSDGEIDEHPEWLIALREAAEEDAEDEEDLRCRAATHPSIARAATAAMMGVVDRGTGTRADIGRPQAGKTGTTTDLVDAWYVGYTPHLSLSVWIGTPGQNDPLPALGGFSQVFGGTMPAVMWADVAEQLLEDVDPDEFPEPGEIVLDVPTEDEGPAVAPARQIPGPPDTGTTEPRDEPADEPDETPADEAEEPEVEEPDDEPDPTDDPDPPEGEEPPPEPSDEDEDEDSCLVVFNC